MTQTEKGFNFTDEIELITNRTLNFTIRKGLPDYSYLEVATLCTPKEAIELSQFLEINYPVKTSQEELKIPTPATTSTNDVNTCTHANAEQKTSKNGNIYSKCGSCGSIKFGTGPWKTKAELDAKNK